MEAKTVVLICISSLLQFSSGQHIECPAEGIAYVPHSKCNKFNICVDGEVAEMECPFDLYYNPESKQCDFPENVSACRGELPPIRMTQCGQSLIADNGTIQYKLNEHYDAGELCVFTIRFETGQQAVNFTLNTHGFSAASDVITILKINTTGLSFEVDFGVNQRNHSFTAWGAAIIFRTSSNSGTGFQMSFERDLIKKTNKVPGIDAVFAKSTESPLHIPFPSNYTRGTVNNYFGFSSESKLITEPNTFFRLNVTVWFGIQQLQITVQHIYVRGRACFPENDLFRER